jgi:hypothetical protein
VLNPPPPPAECPACGHKYHTRYELCRHAEREDDRFIQCDCTESGLLFAEEAP